MYDPLRQKTKVAVYTAVAFLFGIGLASGMGWTGSSHAMPVGTEIPQVADAAVKPALDLSDAFVNLADAVTPAVVRIEARRPARQTSQRVPDVFRRFFDDVPEHQQPPSQGDIAGGSGFIVSEDGYILTNNHVVEDADQVLVYLADRRYFEAEIVGTDPFTDVAVIKIDAGAPLTTLSFGNSDQVRVGEWVLAVGNPGFGASTQLDYTVTSGIVSARGRGLGLLNDDLSRDPDLAEVARYSIEDFIQTDAVINPGNSGGPMVNLRGQVVGINSAIASATGYYQGYGFAIPINLARRVMEDLVAIGHVRRPMLGVEILGVSAEDAEVYGLPSVSGVLVQGVTEGGPAAAAGLRPEDVIVALDGVPVGYSAELQAKIAQHHPGDQVTLMVYRDRRARDIKVRLDEAPLNEPAQRTAENTVHSEERLGIQVAVLDNATAREYEYPEAGGVIITSVARGSAAARRGLGQYIGGKLAQVNDRDIETPADLRRALDAVGGGEIVSLHIEAPDGSSRVVNVRMPN